MTFSILFWNIWYRNQTKESPRRYERLLAELKRLTDQYQPDLVALNELVWPADEQYSPVVTYLQTLGYNHVHYVIRAQPGIYWPTGPALCSRFKLSQKKKMVISKNSYMEKLGYSGLYKQAVSAHVTLPGGRNLTVVVAHPADTIHSLKDHRAGMETLEQLVHSEEYGKNTILIGDMNEWRLIPRAFRRKVANVMYSQTGSVLNPTWRYNAHRFTPLRANLDYVYWNRESDFSLKDFQVLSSDVSDHWPLLATFELAL